MQHAVVVVAPSWHIATANHHPPPTLPHPHAHKDALIPVRVGVVHVAEQVRERLHLSPREVQAIPNMYCVSCRPVCCRLADDLACERPARPLEAARRHEGFNVAAAMKRLGDHGYVIALATPLQHGRHVARRRRLPP